MRSYLIEDISRENMDRIRNYLDKHGYRSSIEDLYWIEVPEELLSPIQREHLSSCGPYIFSLETGKDWIKVELLVRPRATLRCQCIRYASREQRRYVIELVDEIIKGLDIAV